MGVEVVMLDGGKRTAMQVSVVFGVGDTLIGRWDERLVFKRCFLGQPVLSICDSFLPLGNCACFKIEGKRKCKGTGLGAGRPGIVEVGLPLQDITA